jgi:predicted AAA+ superfamily ATPase
MMYERRLRLPDSTLFLLGPRQTGKTTLLKKRFPDALRIDLLQTDQFMKYHQRPSLLRDEVRALPHNRLVVIDEIQKVPILLDEVHYLMQEEQRQFILCGSSARKLKRGAVNLLGGRALRFDMLGLSAMEIGESFSLNKMLNSGPLPNHYASNNPSPFIRAYTDTYLKEEVLSENLVRNLPVFGDFLRMAAIGDTEVTNLSNIARECGLAATTVREHYSILEDTLLGAFVPSFTLRPKRRTVHAPKFYFRDVGVVNHLARRGPIEPGSELFGKAFENWIFHELSVHSRYSERWYEISYWRLSSGIEVDFILGMGETAIEVKGESVITGQDGKGLREFAKDHPQVRQRIIVSLVDQERLTKDGIRIMPYADFLKKLWNNELGP